MQCAILSSPQFVKNLVITDEEQRSMDSMCYTTYDHHALKALVTSAQLQSLSRSLALPCVLRVHLFVAAALPLVVAIGTVGIQLVSRGVADLSMLVPDFLLSSPLI